MLELVLHPLICHLDRGEDDVARQHIRAAETHRFGQDVVHFA